MIRLFGLVLVSFVVAFCSTRPADEAETGAEMVAVANPTIEQMMRVREAELKALRERIAQGDTAFSDIDMPASFSEGALTEHTRELVDDNFHQMADTFNTHFGALIREPDKVKNFNIVVNTCYTCHEMYCPGPLRQIKALLIEE